MKFVHLEGKICRSNSNRAVLEAISREFGVGSQPANAVVKHTASVPAGVPNIAKPEERDSFVSSRVLAKGFNPATYLDKLPIVTKQTS